MLTVSIVTYHTPVDELETCLASLTSRCISQIYIVDNGSEDKLRRWAGQHDRVVYIAADNPGFGAGHNLAIRRALDAGADYHLVLNSDVYFRPAVIDNIYSFMEANPGVGMLQPRITNPDGTMQYTCRRLPTPLDVFGRRFLPKFLNRRRDDRYLLKHLDFSVPHNIPYHQGSFMFIRTSALRQAGLFDERFFMYPEDIDLTRRIHRHYKTLYYPGVSIVHAHRAASYHNLRMTVIHAVNLARYFCKWGWFYDPERRRFNSAIR